MALSRVNHRQRLRGPRPLNRCGNGRSDCSRLDSATRPTYRLILHRASNVSRSAVAWLSPSLYT